MENSSEVVAEISVIPVGTGNPDISSFVRRCIQIAHLSELRFNETPFGAVVFGPLREVILLAEKMHKAPFEQGASRVRTTVVIDEYKDGEEELTLREAAEARELSLGGEFFQP